jgi:putative hemolysin
MAEAVDNWRGAPDAEAAPAVRFSYSRPEQARHIRALIRLIERLSGQPRLERLYRDWSCRPVAGENIFAAAIRLMAIGIDSDDAAWARIPADRPVLFIANHPFGVVDGLIMGHLATRMRPDTKIMTHSLLCQPPEARDFMLPIDFGGTPEAVQTSLLTRRRALDWLAGGHAVAIFPAGSVATAQHPFTGPALDAAWHPFLAKLTRVAELVVVPVYFHGRNSRLFQLASHIHYALRVALIFRETSQLVGSTIRVSIGDPLPASGLPHERGRDAVLQELRRRTLSLAGRDGPDPGLEFRWPRHIRFD